MKFNGEKIIKIEETPFKNYSKEDWCLYFIERYNSPLDGSHHKQWLIAQIAKICNGSEPVIKYATWSDENGDIVESEYRIELENSEQYNKWLKGHLKSGYEEDDEEYDYFDEEELIEEFEGLS